MKANACKHSTTEDSKRLLSLVSQARKSITAAEGPHIEASGQTGGRRTGYFRFGVAIHGNLKSRLTKVGLDTRKKTSKAEAGKRKRTSQVIENKNFPLVARRPRT